MEDKDIIKAISDWYDECKKCFYVECDSDKGCIAELCEDALKLIKNQQAEIDKLKEKCIEDDKLLNDRVTESVNTVRKAHLKYENALEEQLKTAKTEAYKEFAELMRDRLIELLDIIIQPGEKTLGNIADYLLNNGVIVPPVKVGDIVYGLYQECKKETEIIELEIDTVEIHKEYIIINSYKGEHCYRYFLSEIGKTVFLTKEEAEKHLGGVQE